MGRKPSKRANYRQDGIAIHRILTALESDPRGSIEWRSKTLAALRIAVECLLSREAPSSVVTTMENPANVNANRSVRKIS